MKTRKKKDVPSLVGKRFEKLLVLEQKYCDITGKANHGWKTLCDCGNEKDTNTYCLRYGKTKSCGCYQREMFLKSAVKYTDNFALNAMVGEYKFNAKKRNLEFNLTHDECAFLFSQNCYYCNSKPLCIKNTISKNHKQSLIYNGIDRINNTVGYTNNNVVTCCKFCNVAKHDMGYTCFLNWVKNLSDNLREKNLI